MKAGEPIDEGMEDAMSDQIQARLLKTFQKMPYKVPLVLFTRSDAEDLFGRTAREVILAIRRLAPKITLREYNLDHPLAKKWKVEHAPTLIFDPDHYRIRWLGAPAGEEGRTFVEALIMMGYRKTLMSEESLKILGKITSSRKIKLFVSLSCPYCPQQAVNALKAALERPELISLEIVDIQANPGIAEEYSAFSVPQTFANEILVAKGAQTEELFLSSLEKLEEQTIFIPESDAPLIETDLVIVGGGPAGLTAGIYAARSGLQTVLLERGILGGQVATTPVVENYPGITRVGGKTLVDIMVSHALQYVKIFPGEEALEVESGEPIQVITNRRRFKTRALLLATGATYRRLNVPGEARLSGRGVSYCATCDGPLFKGKKVIVVGGGDSAVTDALYLHNTGADVSMVHRRNRLRAQEFLTRSLFAIPVPVLFDTVVTEIRGRDQVEGLLLFNPVSGETTSVPADGVFIAIGYSPTVDLARKIGLKLTPDGFIDRDSRHRTNIPGVYSAGDVEGGYKQIVTAAGQGAEAALAIFEDMVSPYWKSEKVASRE